MSPIAVTRMVTAALGRTQPDQAASATGGLSLGSMPAPEDLGPLGAHLVGDDVRWCRGQVLFAGGSEVAVIDEPRLLEVVRSDDVPSLAHLLEAATTSALAPAEANQVSGGGSNPRFGPLFDEPPADEPSGRRPSRSCAVVADRPEVAAALSGALAGAGRGVPRRSTPPLRWPASTRSTPWWSPWRAGPPSTDAASGWERMLAEHDGIVDADPRRRPVGAGRRRPRRRPTAAPSAW